MKASSQRFNDGSNVKVGTVSMHDFTKLPPFAGHDRISTHTADSFIVLILHVSTAYCFLQCSWLLSEHATGGKLNGRYAPLSRCIYHEPVSASATCGYNKNQQ